MGTELQKCQTPGKVFSQIERTGPSIGGIGEIMRHSDEKVCPNCGGPVIWVDYKGSPLSAYKRMEEANRHLRLGCIGGIIALIGFLALYYFVHFGLKRISVC
jgi:hypothetical protein